MFTAEDHAFMSRALQLTVAKHATCKRPRGAAEIEHAHDFAELLARHR